MKKPHRKQRLSLMIVLAMALQLVLPDTVAHAQKDDQIESVLSGGEPRIDGSPKASESQWSGEDTAPLTEDAGFLQNVSVTNDVYFSDYNDGGTGAWKSVDGNSTFTNVNGKVKVNAVGRTVLIEENTPAIQNGEYELKMAFDTLPQRFGMVVRYADNQNYMAIQYDNDNGSWGWDTVINGIEAFNSAPLANHPLEADREYQFIVRYEEKGVQLWVDDTKVLDFSNDEFPTNSGKVGLRSWSNKNFSVDDLRVTSLPDSIDPVEPVTDFYEKDYNDGNIEGWEAATGTAVFTADHGAVKTETKGAVILADKQAPKFENGEYEVKLAFLEKPSRFGLVVRYGDSKNYSVIQYDTSGWGFDYLVNGKEKWSDISSSNTPSFEPGKQYTFKLRFIEDNFKLWIDGERIFSASLPDLPQAAGKVGLRSWYTNKTIWIDDLKYKRLESQVLTPEPITDTDVIQSKDLSVVIDKQFPRVKEYVWKLGTAEEARMKGQVLGMKMMSVNGEDYVPTLTSYKFENNKAVYGLRVEDENEGIHVEADVEFSVQDNVMNMKIIKIEQLGKTRVSTIGFPNHDLVSVLSLEPQAEQAAAWVTGAWNIVNDEFNDLKSNSTDGGGGRTYAFVNNEKLAATIVNNVVNGNDKTRVSLKTDPNGVRKASIWNGDWTYRESALMEAEPLPWSKIIITGDLNGDNLLNWQDGAIAYRNHAAAPKGYEMIRDHISYISMNIGSTTTMPFLRALDNGKKISNLLDGFGQIILFKGYQAEGHDDSHPDYGGHIGVRQGGAKDFKYVLSEGKKYNIRGGVHINATEYMKDAFEYKPENMLQPDSKGWGWLDQAFYVDQRKDIETGELKRRLDMLKADTGDDLSFVYVDVYSGVDWKAKKLAEYINGNGWMLGTEFAGPLHEQAAWIHWGTDPGYPDKGNNSQIIRFIRNDVMDGFISNGLLKGNKQVGVGYWQPQPELYSYKVTTEAFFNHNLPTKYMQNFPIMKMTEDRVDFKDHVYVVRERDGKVRLYKDDRLLAVMTDSGEITDSTIFIPWDPVQEDKIYHWNPSGGETTWRVPASWSGATTAKLYKLTDLGRKLIGNVPVNDGQVTLTAEKGIGYVLYKQDAPEQPETVWGDGGYAKDPGFDSQGFHYWRKSSVSGDTDHIQIVKNENADDLLQINGPQDGKVEQTLTGLTPGKMYSASVWVNIESDRKVAVGVKQGGSNEEINWTKDTNHPYFAQQHKYLNTPFQRIKVEFEAKSESATLYLQAYEGEAKVRFDDVRVWEHLGKTDKGKSVLFEDFENVDEGWGPFVYSKLGPVRTHLVEAKDKVVNGVKDPGSSQAMTYVLDGHFSLKTNEEGTGEWLRTLSHTLRLEPNRKYRLTMDFNAEVKDMYSVAVRVNENGKIRDLASKTLNAGKGKLDIPFATDAAPGAYLAIIKNFDSSQGELTGTLVIDNIRVNAETKDEGENPGGNPGGNPGEPGGNPGSTSGGNPGEIPAGGSTSTPDKKADTTGGTDHGKKQGGEPPQIGDNKNQVGGEPTENLKDIQGHWAFEAIKRARELGFVRGYEDGTFRPQERVTRGEFAVMLARALGLNVKDAALQAADADSISNWAKESIAALISKGIIKGYGDGTFRANQPITRVEMVVMIGRVLSLSTDGQPNTSFADDDRIPAWAKSSVTAAADKSIVQGQGNNRFAPQRLTTRAEAVTIILNLLANLPNIPDAA